jgi:hypothetical protein
MSETQEAWQRVISAFEEWIEYEATEFAPWTGYFSGENLRELTDAERLGWMYSMIDEIIPKRVERCRQASVAFEDFLPYLPDSDAIETVRSMIELGGVIQDAMLGQSDVISDMIDEYRDGGLDGIEPVLESLSEAEQDIRHHMSLYSQGFGKLRSSGLELPGDME